MIYLLFKKYWQPQERTSTASVEKTPAPIPPKPVWNEPHIPYENYFNLHIYDAPYEEALSSLQNTYLRSAPQTPSAIVQQDGKWLSIYVEPNLALSLGFNRLAHQVAEYLNTWVIGYRIYAEQGLDVHFFNATEHVTQFAVAEDFVGMEPTSAEDFPLWAEVADILPRPEEEHPLDFHFRLLQGLGIQHGAFTWEAILKQTEAGEMPSAQILTG